MDKCQSKKERILEISAAAGRRQRAFAIKSKSRSGPIEESNRFLRPPHPCFLLTLIQLSLTSIPTATSVIINRIRSPRRRIHSGHGILTGASRFVIAGHSGFRPGSVTATSLPVSSVVSAAAIPVFFLTSCAAAASRPVTAVGSAAPSVSAAAHQYQQIKTIHRFSISSLYWLPSPVCPLAGKLKKVTFLLILYAPAQIWLPV